MIFHAWFVNFEYITWISCDITWSVLSSRMRWMALHCTWSTYPCSHCTRETSSIKLLNPLRTCPISHSIFFINLFFPYSCTCAFLEMTSISGQRCCLRLWDHTHIHQLQWVLSHSDVVVVTIPSNKMVLNDVKGKYGWTETGDGVGCGSGVAGWTDLWLNWLFSQTDLLT